jgi:transposase-like protein
MTCIRCQHEACKRFGTYGRRKIERWRCRECKATFSTPQPKIGTHYTDLDTTGKILALMLEGMSIRAIERFTGVHQDTILRIMNTAGAKARILLDSKLQNITPNFVEVDEMWTY